jgi:hypothetical protein
VRWTPACEDMRTRAEERPPLEEVTEHHSEDRDREHYPLCDSDV